MKIHITKKDMLHFFDHPAEGVQDCFYAFEIKPKCTPGEKIYFYYNHVMIATTIIKSILKIKNFYAVIWDFDDLNNLVWAADPMYGSLFYN